MPEKYKNVETTWQLEKGLDNYVPNLQKLLAPFEFDWNLVTQHGAICCDAGPAPEALGIYHCYQPNRLIITEPITQFDKRKKYDKILDDIKQHTPISIIRNPAIEALEQLKKEKIQVGLITRLNILPNNVSMYGLYKFLELSQNLLVPEGIVVTSINSCDRDCAGVQFIRALSLRGSLSELQFDIDNPTFPIDQTIPSNESSIGGLFLIAQKK